MRRQPAAVVAMAMLYISSAPTAGGGGMGADLKPATVAAFDRYVSLAESRIEGGNRRPDRFLHLDSLADSRRAAVLRGEVLVEALEVRDGGKAVRVPDGRVHHWIGAAFIRGAALDDAVELLQDYDRHADIYKPAVQRSKLLARDGDRFRIFLRFYQKKVIAVTVNSEHEAAFARMGPDRVVSRIRSTRIAEVADAGEPTEHEKPVGRDGGYLWRLNTYWRFLQRDGGTHIQCESITLTRDIPFGFGWLIGPFVTSIPRESLAFTMERTRDALSAKTPVRIVK